MTTEERQQIREWVERFHREDAQIDETYGVFQRLLAEFERLEKERDEWERRVEMAQFDEQSFHEPQIKSLEAQVARLTTERDRLLSTLISCRQWIEPVVEGFGLDPKTHVILEHIESVVLETRKTAPPREGARMSRARLQEEER